MGLGGGVLPPFPRKPWGNTPFTLPPFLHSYMNGRCTETNLPSKIPLGKKFSKNHTYVIFGGENQAGKKGRERERETKGGKENLNNHTA